MSTLYKSLPKTLTVGSRDLLSRCLWSRRSKEKKQPRTSADGLTPILVWTKLILCFTQTSKYSIFWGAISAATKRQRHQSSFSQTSGKTFANADFCQSPLIFSLATKNFVISISTTERKRRWTNHRTKLLCSRINVITFKNFCVSGLPKTCSFFLQMAPATSMSNSSCRSRATSSLALETCTTGFSSTNLAGIPLNVLCTMTMISQTRCRQSLNTYCTTSTLASFR